MNKEEIKASEIKWISVYDQLPKDGVSVITMIKGSDLIFTQTFDPTYGWKILTRTFSYDRTSCIESVMFWSYYNLPK